MTPSEVLKYRANGTIKYPDRESFNWYSHATAPIEAWTWFYRTCFDWTEV